MAIRSGIAVSFCKTKINYIYLIITRELLAASSVHCHPNKVTRNLNASHTQYLGCFPTKTHQKVVRFDVSV